MGHVHVVMIERRWHHANMFTIGDVSFIRQSLTMEHVAKGHAMLGRLTGDDTRVVALGRITRFRANIYYNKYYTIVLVKLSSITEFGNSVFNRERTIDSASSNFSAPD